MENFFGGDCVIWYAHFVSRPMMRVTSRVRFVGVMLNGARVECMCCFVPRAKGTMWLVVVVMCPVCVVEVRW